MREDVRIQCLPLTCLIIARVGSSQFYTRDREEVIDIKDFRSRQGWKASYLLAGYLNQHSAVQNTLSQLNRVFYSNDPIDTVLYAPSRKKYWQISKLQENQYILSYMVITIKSHLITSSSSINLMVHLYSRFRSCLDANLNMIGSSEINFTWAQVYETMKKIDLLIESESNKTDGDAGKD